MTASARIYSLTRDERTDRDEWGEPIWVYDGHWNPAAALTTFFHNEEPDAGTYKCDSSGGSAVLGWDGDRVVVLAA